MGKQISTLLSTALVAVLCGTASAYTLKGTVTDNSGKVAIQGAEVKLLNRNNATTTDEQGKFTLQETTTGIAQARSAGGFNVSNGVLNFTQSGSTPVQVKIFDLVGNQVFAQTFQGSGSVDLNSVIEAKGTYMARVKLGSAQETIRFNASGNFSGSAAQKHQALMKQDNTVDTLRITKEGFDTLKIFLPTVDTTLSIFLNEVNDEPTFAFGYALKNRPTPSKGCGKTSTLQKTKSVENGDRFEMKVNGETREYFITLPKNYDNTKPYKLLFAMHCMGSNAEDFVHHGPDQDHPSPYYGQQKLDTEGNYIFVSPRGDTDGMPWSMNSDKDHKFIDQLLTTLEENYCIDTSRVFMTGFSFGAMVTNSMAQDMQDRLRAVAVYATADYNIYLPKNKGLPIAWMAVHGKNDGTCNYNRARDSALKRILKNNGKADEAGNFTDASAEKPKEINGNGHLCYDFTTVDERFPVKFCSWNGQHQWTAYDSGNWQNTWVPEEVHKFFEQF